MQFKNWHEIKDWCEAHGHKMLADRLQLNNDCWNSCGEFGRNQVYICDSLRYTEDEDECEAVATALETEMFGDSLYQTVGR